MNRRTNNEIFRTMLDSLIIGNDTYFNQHFTLPSGSADKYPPYNIYVPDGGNDTAVVEIALAGFSKDDITVSVNDDVLSIKGVYSVNHAKDHFYKVKNMSTKSFEKRFTLAAYMKVNKVTFIDGLLTIRIDKEVPEEEKPKIINIQDY